jgi:hypothetical protein
VRGDPIAEGQKTAQEGDLARTPARDLDKIIRARHHPAKHDQLDFGQQNFGQRINRLPTLPGVFERREMIA